MVFSPIVGQRVAASIAIVLVALGAGWPASAEPVDQCIEAFETAQEERDQGKLTRARELLVTCSKEPCPAVLRQECGEWLFELERRIPTLVLRASIAGGPDLADVRVYVDDELLTSRLDGRAVRVDPGVRRLRWEYLGFKPVEKEIIVREGEKNRFVSIVFESEVADEAAAPKPDERPSDTDEGIPVAAWVAGGIGIGGLAAFAILGLSVQSGENELSDNCAPNCDPDEVHSLENQAVLANVALGVGVAGLAVAAILALASDSEPTSAKPLLDVRATLHGASAVLSGRF